MGSKSRNSAHARQIVVERLDSLDPWTACRPAPPSGARARVGSAHHMAGAAADYLQRNQLAAVFMAPLDVVLSDFDVVAPDVLYISRERFEC